MELGSYLGMLEGLLKFKEFIREFKEPYLEDIERIRRSILEIAPEKCIERDFESPIQKIRDQMKVKALIPPNLRGKWGILLLEKVLMVRLKFKTRTEEPGNSMEF